MGDDRPSEFGGGIFNVYLSARPRRAETLPSVGHPASQDGLAWLIEIHKGAKPSGDDYPFKATVTIIDFICILVYNVFHGVVPSDALGKKVPD